jgi:hypothetical protein
LPAIQPARLKIQAESLAQKAGSPAEFRRALSELLESYANRAYRPGKGGELAPLLPAYHVPQPVLKQILSALQTFVETDETAVLALCDALWSEPNYESRLLAVFLLGQIPVDPPGAVLQRFASWARPGTDRRLVELLVERGLSRMRQEQRERYLEEAAACLKSDNVFFQQLGLKCLEQLVCLQDFEDYPSVTRILEPLLRSGSTLLRPDLLRVVRALGRKSPKETGFFLRQNLVHKVNNLNTAWLIRHCLADFPVETQDYLREGLRENS